MKFHHLLLSFLLVIVWGFNFVIIKLGFHELPPLFFAFSRFFLTSLPAIFFVKPPKVPFRMVILYSLFLYVLQFSLFFIGLKEGMPVAIGALILQLQVFFTLIFAFFFFKEKLNKLQITGILISFSGIGLLTFHFGGEFTCCGFFLLLFAAISWGLGNVISKKIGKVNMFSLVVWGSFVAWPPLLLLSFLIEGPEVIFNSITHLSFSHGGIAILYNTYLATLFGFMSWSWLLSRYPLTTIAPFSLMVPIIAALSGFIFLNEPLERWKETAALFILLGLAVNFIGDRYRKISDKGI